MFEHPQIQTYAFDDIPLDRDISLMDERWMVEFEAALIKSIEGSGETAYSVGQHAFASARAVNKESIELSWYPGNMVRFHEMRITLPAAEFVLCVASWQLDYKPIIFVRSKWLADLYMRSHSVFALVDAIGVKRALENRLLTRQKLIDLRNSIDEIATKNPEVAFVSFADSLLLKSNYSVGFYEKGIKNSYRPELILRLLPDIQAAYQKVLGLSIYAVVAQGINEYYQDDLLHISATENHISLNSLGLPFAQLLAIDHAAREAIKSQMHRPSDTYLDKALYHSLRFKHSFEKNKEASFSYRVPMISGAGSYFPISFQQLDTHLEPISTEPD